MDSTQALTNHVPGQYQHQPVSEVHVVWQYRDDPETATREYQFLGVFSTHGLARQRTAGMRGSGWTIQIAAARLDPDDVC
ncbi:MAG: hypothetical protein ACRDOK_17545 [Streptosporangiaceae bacterium]